MPITYQNALTDQERETIRLVLESILFKLEWNSDRQQFQCKEALLFSMDEDFLAHLNTAKRKLNC